MDITLANSSEDARLVFQNCHKFDDGSGYCVDLRMRSGDFQLGTTFYFEDWPLKQFIEGLMKMNETLTGKATLKPMWEDDYIELAATTLGHIEIVGEFAQYGSFEQRLKFGLETDQTCLQPLISGLKRLTEQS
jgi:hypothetical protein